MSSYELRRGLEQVAASLAWGITTIKGTGSNPPYQLELIHGRKTGRRLTLANITTTEQLELLLREENLRIVKESTRGSST